MERQATIGRIMNALDMAIMQREGEPPHRSGFCAVDPATGMDKRNRFGRRCRAI
jgi:hypothetical protein